MALCVSCHTQGPSFPPTMCSPTALVGPVSHGGYSFAVRVIELGKFFDFFELVRVVGLSDMMQSSLFSILDKLFNTSLPQFSLPVIWRCTNIYIMGRF